MAQRIENNVSRGQAVELDIDGVTVSVYEGETLASALLLARKAAFYRTAAGTPRVPYCNMGVCFECRVQVEGMGWVLACMTPVQAGMQVRTELPLAGARGDGDGHGH